MPGIRRNSKKMYLWIFNEDAFTILKYFGTLESGQFYRDENDDNHIIDLNRFAFEYGIHYVLSEKDEDDDSVIDAIKEEYECKLSILRRQCEETEKILAKF